MRVLIVVAVLASLIALALAGRALYQVSRQCVKQCDWGDKRCADMCGARHFCPAHPDGI
jgi:hypothetical protein